MVSFELLMFENVFVVVISDLVEIIHVQLPNKRWEVSVAKMYRKHLFLKFLDIDDDEIGPLLVPGDDILVDVVFQDLISFGDEDRRAWTLLFSPSGLLINFFEVLWGIQIPWGWFLFCEHFRFSIYFKV